MSQAVVLNSMPATQNNAQVATDGVKRRRVDESRGMKSFMPDLLDAKPTYTDKNKHKSVVRTLACSSDHICSGSADKEVNLWKCNESTFSLERTLDGHDFGVCSLDMADNVGEKGLIVAAMMSGEMKIWDIRQHKFLYHIDASPGDVSQVRFHRTDGGTVLISGGAMGDLVKWDLRTRKESGRISLGCGSVQSIAVTGLGYAACGMETGLAPIVNLVENTIIARPWNHRLPVRALAFSRDARRLVCASNDGHISVINPRVVKEKESSQGTYEQLFSAHADWVTSVAFHPSGPDYLLTAGRDKAIRAWKLGSSNKDGRRTGDLKKQWEKSVALWSIAYATNGEFFATGDAERAINVYRQKEPSAPNGTDPS